MEFTSTGTEYVDSFFAHHGIKGQKWGIRRFQNEDGTLTEEGLKRYGHDYDKKGRLKRSAKKDDEKLIKDMRKVYDLHRKSRVASMKASNRLVDMVKEDQKAGKHITDTSDDKKLNKHVSKMEKYAAKREDELEKIMVNYITKHGSLRLDDILDIAASKASTIGSISNPYLNKMYTTYNEVIKGMAHRVDEKTKDVAHEGNDGTVITFNDVIGIAIAHSGIKGQKWGLRRFQYNDGSLTPEGRKRYLKGGDKAVRKAEKQRAKREAILSDRKKLYKHRNEFTKEEIDKAMARFASQDALRMQMNAEKEAKRHDRAELKRSKIEYKKLKLQQKQMAEQEKQAKLSTEQKKLETEQKKESADVQAASTRWRERVNKAKTVVEFAKVGKDILDDMGITSKEEGESLLGSLATAIGIKDVSAKKAAAELKKQREKAQADWDFETKKMAYEKAKEEFNDRAAKKQRQEAMDELKRRQEEAKTKTAEYNANNPGKGGKGGGLTADDIEDILKKYGVI